ncbi:hypothetical protein QCA50_017751 [Cerrena zonata]|uniref:C3H1-type domain-containing protein n=1 Tax=Cerrena zonata TaxID=2478898 RepID=A0AAW0FNR5_9APHY
MNTQLHHTKLCRNYALGSCPQGDRCRFIHSDQIVFPPTFVTGPQSSTGPMSPTGQASNTTRLLQFRALSWRTKLCKHFVKNQGWCSLGDECGYIHDLRLAEHARNDIRYPDGHRRLDSSKQSHCWAYVHGVCRAGNCPYVHPLNTNLFIPHTPCLSWPGCDKGRLCCFKHPEPLIPKLFNFHPEPFPNIPLGTYQALGTTYFPIARDPNTPTSPSTLVPYSPSAHSGFSPYLSASLPYSSLIYETKRAPGRTPSGRYHHTHRTSVTSNSKEDSGVLGLSHASRRPRKMSHSKRDTHRVSLVVKREKKRG